MSKSAEEYLKSIEGKRPTRAWLGWGSFLVFDFGELRMKEGHPTGESFLWIYMCDWKVFSHSKVLADSERNRTFLKTFVQDFERRTLESIKIERSKSEEKKAEYKTTFHFSGEVNLICTPYSEEPDENEEDDPCWYFFAPDGMVVESFRESERIVPAKMTERIAVNS